VGTVSNRIESKTWENSVIVSALYLNSHELISGAFCGFGACISQPWGLSLVLTVLGVAGSAGLSTPGWNSDEYG